MQSQWFSCRLCGDLTEHWFSRYLRLAARIWLRVYVCSQCLNETGVEM